MNVKTIEARGHTFALVTSASILLSDQQSALDFVMTISSETASERIALNKEAISEDFFKLHTGLAGEILQKFINYNIKFAIVGDFSSYTSKPLKDFIYECNKGHHIFFVSTDQEAVERLAGR
ncbi:DUF4180 domain-containing protein [Jeotgalibacillus sp. ET6]|uniref:DUF4180 domain-containing protein n=1 Tax=Jeotgalibacillus sp. ET6 TaxID=3037260 RepID=UPI0024189C10|nr:DUF4180 domain-containing protein [Jeotgalibacillus sp. ET6]MDG5473141.1 DUF4180 domain-containing protein [Jeotgalibacillus sp. ET6]